MPKFEGRSALGLPLPALKLVQAQAQAPALWLATLRLPYAT